MNWKLNEQLISEPGVDFLICRMHELHANSGRKGFSCPAVVVFYGIIKNEK